MECSLLTDWCVLSAASLHGFALWFDVSFGTRMRQRADLQSEPSMESPLSGDNDSMGINRARKRPNPSDSIVLSTSPEGTPTHWAQVL